MLRWFRAPGMSLFILVFLSPLGCSNKKLDMEVVQKETENLRKVYDAYVAASGQLRRPPQNMDELTPYLRKAGTPEELLRSRTGEPYEIVWKVNPRGFSQKASYPNILAYEKTGVNGSHYIVTSMGVASVSDEELSRILAAQK
jgi:hypothetical protein